MTNENLSESTPEQPFSAVEARHGTRPATEPASTESDTPEGRLLARKGSTQYLDDVRALIAERDEWRRLVIDAGEVAASPGYMRQERDRIFGTIRTTTVDE